MESTFAAPWLSVNQSVVILVLVPGDSITVSFIYQFRRRCELRAMVYLCHDVWPRVAGDSRLPVFEIKFVVNGNGFISEEHQTCLRKYYHKRPFQNRRMT